jgi:hypothetical protein
VPQPTLSATNSEREAEEPSDKQGITGEAEAADQSQLQNVPTTQDEAAPPIPPAWQVILAGIAVLSGSIMLLMRQTAADRWRQKP